MTVAVFMLTCVRMRGEGRHEGADQYPPTQNPQGARARACLPEKVGKSEAAPDAKAQDCKHRRLA